MDRGSVIDSHLIVIPGKRNRKAGARTGAGSFRVNYKFQNLRDHL
jgi:hypothetical protein